MFSEEDLKSVWLLRRMAAMLEEDTSDATERVLERMSKTKNNAEFLLTLKDAKV